MTSHIATDEAAPWEEPPPDGKTEHGVCEIYHCLTWTEKLYKGYVFSVESHKKTSTHSSRKPLLTPDLVQAAVFCGAR